MRTIRFFSLLLALMLLLTACTSDKLETKSSGEHHTVTTADYDEMYWEKGLNYSRIIELQHAGDHNGTLVATYEAYTAGLRVEKPGYNIHVSRDGGVTWQQVSTVREKAASIQSEWQPHLCELPQQLGDMPAGTLLLAACSIDAGHARQTALRLYRSYDVGQTWEQFGTVALGGGMDTGVWEPFLMMLPDGRLACYYSDSNEAEKHSQKVVMKITEDGVNWGEVIDIVALEKQSLRPGMPTVVQMNDGRYIMAYEMVDEADGGNGNPVYYRFSKDGINWGDPKDSGTKLVTNKKVVPGSSPYLAYVPDYGEKGLLLMTSGFQTPGDARGNVVYYNTNLGDEKSWRVWYQPVEYQTAYNYSHGMFVAADRKTVHFINTVPDENSEEGYYKVIYMNVQFEK